MDLDFLLTDEQMEEVEPQIHIPTEGFATTGFVAEWMAKVMYTFMVEGVDIEMQNRQLKDMEEKTYPVPDAMIKFDSGWYRYWYTKDGDAREACNLLKLHEGLDRKPRVSTVWRFEAQAASCLNLSEAAAEAFGDILAWECNISTLNSVYRRHEFHMIALPAAVHAVAQYMGLAVPDFSLEELTESDIVYTPEYQVAMIGTEPQERADNGYQHVNAKNGYSSALLWQRREILWKALGEENAKKFRVKGAGTKYDTSADALNKCLQIVERPWTKPVWGLLVPVRDPRLDATMKNGTRLSIPALAKMYRSQAEAQEAATELMGTQAEATGQAAGPALPAMWEGQKDTWVGYVEQVREKLAGKPPIPPNVQAAVADVFGSVEQSGATVPDFINWLQ